ncbi:MAG: ParM/StbA family protein [Lachnospiraceae bacterium]|nr:ParM/StbA family protein [Lachnospiraceae bacterium]
MKSGSRYIIGLDHGNHLIKTANHIMQNGVKRLGAKPTFPANTLNYGKAYYKVGEDRTNVKDSKMADDDYYILTLTMLAKEAKTRGIPQGSHIVLAVGMPLKQFSAERNAFIRYLKRDSQPVSFKYEDTAYKFYLDKVVVFPQCYAAVVSRLPSMKECLIVDIGSWTIDIMEVRGGVPVESHCETFSESLVSVIQNIRSESSELLKKEISENRIVAYMQGDAENIPKQHQKLMDAALERFAARVEGLLKENGHDTQFTDMIYAGGGAAVMKKYGRAGSNVSYIVDVRANAIGYEYIAGQIA